MPVRPRVRAELIAGRWWLRRGGPLWLDTTSRLASSGSGEEVAVVWTGAVWVVRDRLPDAVWIVLLLGGSVWVARAGARVLSGFVGPVPQPAGSLTVYVDDWGDQPEEAVRVARRLGCDLHPGILEREGPTRVAVAIRVSERHAESLRAAGADVSLRSY